MSVSNLLDRAIGWLAGWLVGCRHTVQAGKPTNHIQVLRDKRHSSGGFDAVDF
jgi:hypothetical protein